jgi:hypothetical protein
MKLGFARAVTLHGDQWRTGSYLEAYRKNLRRVGDALVRSGDDCSYDFRDFLNMRFRAARKTQAIT